MKKILPFLCAALLCFISCAGPLSTRKPLPDKNPKDLMRNIAGHASRIHSFEGIANLSIVSEEGNFRATMQIQIKQPDSLRFKISGPLGINMAAGRFGNGAGQVYVPYENKMYTGTFERMMDLGVLPMDMPFSNMAYGVLGLLVPEAFRRDSLLSMSVVKDHYKMEFENGEHMFVSPSGPVITHWGKTDYFGTVMWTWEGERFERISGVYLPRMIRITSYFPRQRITFYYDVVRPNSRFSSDWFAMKIPEGVDIVEL